MAFNHIIYKLIVHVFIIIMPVLAKAQGMNYRQADSATYHMYIEKQWDSLIASGKTALKNDIDYFYLRVRMGMAYYHKEKFRKAARELEKALAFNSADTYTLKYLYNSYYNGGQKSFARSVTKRFSPALDQELGIVRREIISGVYAEGGFTFSNAETKESSIDIDGTENIYGETVLPGNLSYLTLGVRHRIGNYLNIFHAYTNLVVQMKQYIKVNNINIPNTNNLVQDQYYVQAEIILKRKISLVPAFHYIGLNYMLLSSWYDSTISRYLFHQVNTKLSNYVISLSINKDYPYISGYLSGSYSNLNYKTQSQLNLNFTVFPFANLKLYTSTTISGMAEKGAQMDPPAKAGWFSKLGLGQPRLIIEQMIGGKILKPVYLEASFTWGDISDYNTKNAYYVYNVPDQIIYRVGASLIFELSRNVDLSLSFDYAEKKNDYIRYLDLNNYTTGNFTYQNKTISGGLKWRL